ncbi:MAG: M13 family metallopeptidase, partial [Byssovorax sp.]
MSRTTAGLASALLLAAACEPQPPETPRSPAPPVTTVTATAPATAPAAGPRVKAVDLAAVGLDADALDRRADPCQDFYQFTCGGWIEKAQIPADRPLTSRGFVAITERNEEALRKILEEARARPDADPISQKIGAFYGTCMDEAAVERAGLDGIAPLLTSIKNVKDKTTLLAALSELHRRQIWALFSVEDEQDFKDASKEIVELDQSGLGLPDRDSYFRKDDKSQKIRATYQEHVEKMLGFAGFKGKDAKKAAEDILALETALAQASKTRVERRDPAGMYNKIDLPGIAKAAPAVDWKAYFKSIGLPGVNDVNVTHVAFFEKVNELVETTRPAVWKSYLTWHVLRSSSQLLPRAVQDEAFRMEAAITGQKEQRARWKKCVAATDASLGELLAQPFVKTRFSPAAKEAMERYVAEISRAFAEQVTRLDWMDAATQKRAMEKLSKMAYLVGYPGKWRSYDFAVEPKSWWKTGLAARAFDQQNRLGRVGKPVDRGR